MSDDDIRNLLIELDDSEENVNSWEAMFLENVAFASGLMSINQRKKAMEILEKYGYLD